MLYSDLPMSSDYTHREIVLFTQHYKSLRSANVQSISQAPISRRDAFSTSAYARFSNEFANGTAHSSGYVCDLDSFRDTLIYSEEVHDYQNCRMPFVLLRLSAHDYSSSVCFRFLLQGGGTLGTAVRFLQAFSCPWVLAYQ